MSSPASGGEDSPWSLSLKARLKQVNPVVVLLILFFAFSSWIDMYGVFVQIPILVHKLPEGWTLPSYVIVLVECAMISPIIYSLVNKCCPGNIQRREVIMAYIIMAVGFVALILMTIFWDYTVWIAGSERSLAILLLILFLAMVDTTSCVVYLPYMARFKEHYMPAYVAGEEMGGLITGFVGLIQGSGGEATCYNRTVFLVNETTGENYTDTTLHVEVKEPLFPVSGFFLFLSSMMAVSMISFSLLTFSGFAKKEMVSDAAYAQVPTSEMEKTNGELQIQNEMYQPEAPAADTGTTDKFTEAMKDGKNQTQHDDDSVDDSMKKKKKTKSRTRLWFCCVVYVWSAFIVYGIFSSVHSFSTLPYGALSYTLAVRLLSVVNPIAAFAAFIQPTMSLRVLGGLVCLSSSLAGFHFYLALQSPEPPLQGTTIGVVIVISTAVILSGTFAYTRACIAAVLRSEGGHQALFYGGACIQLGAFVGGILGFVLVNVVGLFESIPMCG